MKSLKLLRLLLLLLLRKWVDPLLARDLSSARGDTGRRSHTQEEKRRKMPCTDRNIVFSKKLGIVVMHS